MTELHQPESHQLSLVPTAAAAAAAGRNITSST